jgi:hypothetical protein
MPENLLTTAEDFDGILDSEPRLFEIYIGITDRYTSTHVNFTI